MVGSNILIMIGKKPWKWWQLMYLKGYVANYSDFGFVIGHFFDLSQPNTPDGEWFLKSIFRVCWFTAVLSLRRRTTWMSPSPLEPKLEAGSWLSSVLSSSPPMLYTPSSPHRDQSARYNKTLLSIYSFVLTDKATFFYLLDYVTEPAIFMIGDQKKIIKIKITVCIAIS